LQGDWTEQLYCFPVKHKSKPEHEYQTCSMGSTTGSALIAPSVSSTSADSDDDEYDDCRVLLWKVNPRPPNSKEVNATLKTDFPGGGATGEFYTLLKVLIFVFI
jgi:hypothetical protein